MPIKLSKRDNQKTMIMPGLRDNGIMPSSGSSASGITLDYSAIQMGGIDNSTPYNSADDEHEVKYPAGELTTNWWAGDYKIKYAGKLWESATALLWPWINKVQLTRIEQKSDGTWKEVHKVVDVDDMLVLQPLMNAVDDLYSPSRETPSSMTRIPTDEQNNSYVGHYQDEGFDLRKNLDYGTASVSPGKRIRLAQIINLPQYSNPNMYEQNSNPRNETEPELTTYEDMGEDMAETRMGEAAEKGKEQEGDEIEVMDEEMGYKRAFPDWPIYNSDQLYSQVTEGPDYATTPSFNMWNANAVDDEIEVVEYDEVGDEMPTLTKEEENAINQELYANWLGKLKEWLNKIEMIEMEANKAGITSEQHPDYGYFTGLRDEIVEELNEDFPGWQKDFTGGSVLFGADKKRVKQAFIKTAVSYDSNQILQDLIKIPQVKALLDQQLSGFADKVIITTPGADVANTQQQSNVKLEPISGNPFGHVFISEDPITHEKKPLDRIVRIDRAIDPWQVLVTALHEGLHLRHPTHSEGQIESEAQRLADTVKQFLINKPASKKIQFVKSNLQILPPLECELADTYQKQVIGLQNHYSLHRKTGMLFSYARPQALSFWMGKVAFPIDIIFIDADNSIRKIAHNCLPGSQEIYACDNASKVIEVVGSFCAFHDLEVGDKVFEADDDLYNQEEFAHYILELIKKHKIEQQKQLGMEDWNIKIVMRHEPDSRRFMKVNWGYKDYKMNKADLIINPDPLLITEALKKMTLDKLVRHSLLHILAGAKYELPEDKESELITAKL